MLPCTHFSPFSPPFLLLLLPFSYRYLDHSSTILSGWNCIIIFICLFIRVVRIYTFLSKVGSRGFFMLLGLRTCHIPVFTALWSILGVPHGDFVNFMISRAKRLGKTENRQYFRHFSSNSVIWYTILLVFSRAFIWIPWLNGFCQSFFLWFLAIFA